MRELQGALNRVLAVQELEGRSVTAEEVGRLLGVGVQARNSDEFGAFLSDIAGTVGEVVSSISPEQRIADAILRWEGEGYRTRRLEAALASPPTAADAEAFVAAFEQDVERLNDLARQMREMDPGARELARLEVLRNPDRVADAEALLAEVEARMRVLPAPPAHPTFAELSLDPTLLAVRAAEAIAATPGERYNPFYVHGPASSGKAGLLVALANAVRARSPDASLAYLTGNEFVAELMNAIQNNHVDGWRTRYRRARVLVLDGVDALARTERVQEELFHLFDDLLRSGGQLVFGAEQLPRALTGLEDRLRTRLESGLVVDLAARAEGDVPAPAIAPAAAAPQPATAAVAAVAAGAPPAVEGSALDDFFMSKEKALWMWPYVEDWLETDAG